MSDKPTRDEVEAFEGLVLNTRINSVTRRGSSAGKTVLVLEVEAKVLEGEAATENS